MTARSGSYQTSRSSDDATKELYSEITTTRNTRSQWPFMRISKTSIPCQGFRTTLMHENPSVLQGAVEHPILKCLRNIRLPAAARRPSASSSRRACLRILMNNVGLRLWTSDNLIRLQLPNDAGTAPGHSQKPAACGDSATSQCAREPASKKLRECSGRMFGRSTSAAKIILGVPVHTSMDQN